MTYPDFSFERAALKDGARCIAGVDEVGRGPLAGPVTAAAVILDPQRIPDGLNDSKKLTAARREAVAQQIMDQTEWSVAHVDVADIDRLIAGLLDVFDFVTGDGVTHRPGVIDGVVIHGASFLFHAGVIET